MVLEERREVSSCWSENSFDQKKSGGLSYFLKEKCQINGEAFCYVSCRFGLDLKRDPNGFEAVGERLYYGDFFGAEDIVSPAESPDGKDCGPAV